jgi:hypothetical protein
MYPQYDDNVIIEKRGIYKDFVVSARRWHMYISVWMVAGAYLG